MSESSITIRPLRDVPAESKSGVMISRLLDVSADNVSKTLADHIQQHAAQAGLPPTLLGFLAEEAAQALSNQLRLDVFELVFKAWAAVRELLEYTDPSKHPPGETSIVRWGKCSIEAPQAIDLKLGVAGVDLPLLRFTIDLKAEFHSLALTIRDGAIHKLTPGPASASVALKYGDVTLVNTRKTPELTFDHGIEFRPGLNIALG